MLTGYGQSVGPDNPVDAVLQKPLDLPRLRTVLDQFLNQTGETLPAPVLAQIAKSN